MTDPCVRLRDGREVVIHTGVPCDKACLAQAFDQLSVRSRHMRFFSPINKLSDAQLSYLTEVDGINHVVLAALLKDDEQHEGIGIGRYIRNKDDSGLAEFAITVSDSYQGFGVGSLLLDALRDHAKGNRVRTLRGYVLSANKPMIKMLERRGARCIEADMGTVCCDLETE